MRNIRRKTVIELSAGVILFAVIAIFPSQLLGLAGTSWQWLKGARSECPVAHQVDSFATLKRQNDSSEAVEKASRLIETDAEGRELWETPRGQYWTPPGSKKEFFYDLGEQQRGIYAFQGGGVRKGDIVLDCGASLGVYTRTALAAGAAKVIAIEPVPMNVECMRKTFKDEIAAGRVVVYPKGVWDKEDFLEMNIDTQNSAAHSFVGTHHETGMTKMRLPLTTIDAARAELGLPRVDFIKFDIEGAERRALAGAQNTLRQFKPRMAVSVYHLPDDPAVIPTVIGSARNDYRYICGPCLWSPERIAPEVFFFQ